MRGGTLLVWDLGRGGLRHGGVVWVYWGEKWGGAGEQWSAVRAQGGRFENGS